MVVGIGELPPHEPATNGPFYGPVVAVNRYGTKTISRVAAPTENGEPEIDVSVPVLGSRANPATSWGTMLTYTNLPVGSTAIDDGWALAPSEIGDPVKGVKPPAESIV